MGDDSWTDPSALLRTLRRLPSGADLGAVRDPEVGPVLRGLLAAEPSVVQCARLSLREELVAVRSLLAATRGASTVDDLGSDEALGAAVGALHEVDGIDEVLRGEQFPLLAAAWSSSEPVAWLARERPALVTASALRVAVHELRLTHQDVGEIVRVVRPGIVAGDGEMRVEVSGIELGVTGFRIESAAVLPDPAPRIAGWSGFDRVTDDLGHEYLVTSFESAPGDGLGIRRERVRQVCFPAVAAGASRLVLTSDGYQLTEVIRTGAQDARPDVTVGSVPLRLALDVPLEQ